MLAGIMCLSATVIAAQQLTPLVMDDEPLVEEEELRRYTVELIVFSYAESVSAGTEIFIPDPIDDTLQYPETVLPIDALDPEARTDEDRQFDILLEPQGDDDGIPAFGDLLPEYEDVELVELISADTIDLQITMADDLTMIDIHEKLVLLDAYRPVLWAGWTQVILSEEETPTIRLRRLGNLPLTFEGSVKLYLSRFLHLVVDVAMDGEPVVPVETFPAVSTRRYGRRFRDDYDYPFTSTAPTPEVHYQIIENRIVKNEDIRYFDHPKFGIVAKVTRYEAPDEDELMEDGGELQGLEEESEPIVPGAALSQTN